jgi:hypothetical protein
VSSHELSTIQGLEDKHLRALARHGVTDVRGLVQADPEVIYRAMVNLRPRPSRDLVARWYESARSTLAETTDDVAEWQLVASFVVVFFQRRAGDTWERRVEAERTEVEPERNPQVWTGWETGPISDWMLGQLGQGNGAEPASGGGTVGEATQAAEEEGAGAAGAEEAGAAGAERPALRIDSAVIIDAAGRTDVVTAGAVAAGPPRELVAPVRVAFTVSGAPPGTRLWAVARVLRRDGPGWNARDPVAVPGSGEVEIDLSAVPAGEHDMGLMAWAPDAAAKPVSVRLPAITIRSG